mmetsp:Transcript_14361/g.34779  ORF Transcript_14361/g.34779 Transcript_14361/m.34779 type:complete len:110 (+) Transcript_14361:121-450(+)|eukprot:CAMPEP_0113624342 /NCGR_PEP_ID=MMETSP0017_2-20120614/12543_1 /TAXON_ID=2856 /ORGANISM="Cylindrotheca closterium" /LENGTH=109 /DNA_ID=CAMNT_0000534359 /DNA_START=75 /DNA_END=404 /DNA_ORIENTATION=- /assembly_acc=CAM_ASM_000147
MFKFCSQLILAFALLVALLSEPSNARLTTGHRHLKSCEDSQALYGRCCGVDLSACKCPLREYEGFGDFIVTYLWDSSCSKLEKKIEECSMTVGDITAPVDSVVGTAGAP